MLIQVPTGYRPTTISVMKTELFEIWKIKHGNLRYPQVQWNTAQNVCQIYYENYNSNKIIVF